MNKTSPSLRICLFLLLLTLMVASDNTSQGFEPRIVFVSDRDGDWDIYSMDVDGDNLIQLTDHPASDEYPACSPDGRRIAFQSDRGVTRDLYVMDSDGNNVVRLTHDNFFEARASWTPDSRKIAFASFCQLNCDIFAMDVDGGNRKRLTKHEMNDVMPSWSPDGSKIAFTSFRDGAEFGPFHVFVMNADGTGKRNLTRDTDLMRSVDPTWSPDGNKIVFSSKRQWGNAEADIYVMTAEGKELERLRVEGDNKSPVYSPEGRSIAFVSHRGGGYKICLMDTNGRNVVTLTRTPPGIDSFSPYWSPSALAVNPNGKLPISWGEIKRKRNP